MNQAVALHKLFSRVALVAFLFLARGAHAAVSPCITWFAIPFVDGPAVCGEALSGGDSVDGSPVNTTAAPIALMYSGSSVAVGAVGTGIGATGFEQASGTFGDLKAHAEAHEDPPIPPYYNGASIRSRATIGYMDGFTVTTTQAVRITSSISGSFFQLATSVPLGTANVDFILQENSPSGAWGQYGFIILDEANAFIYKLLPSSIYVRDVVLTPGNYTFRWSMIVDASASVSSGDRLDGKADVRGRLFFDSLTPNATPITFLSGHSYVPEPDGAAMTLAGWASLGLVARRKFSAYPVSIGLALSRELSSISLSDENPRL